MNLQENIRRILKEERNISDIIKIVAKEYNCSTWEINNGYCEDFALNVLEKLGGYEDNLFELSGDMFFNQRDPEFAKENWGDVIETNYGVWSKNLLDYWGYPQNVNLNLVDDEINNVWLFYNGKHYDAEVPEGVDNWFEIPLIKRLFNRYKKNMVQENIRKVLKEETDHLRMMLRRLPSKTVKKIDEEFDSSLNYISKMFIKTYKSDPRKLSEHEFTRMVIIDLMSLLDVRNHLPNDVEWYGDVLNGLSKHYKKRITSMYNVLKK